MLIAERPTTISLIDVIELAAFCKDAHGLNQKITGDRMFYP